MLASNVIHESVLGNHSRMIYLYYRNVLVVQFEPKFEIVEHK